MTDRELMQQALDALRLCTALPTWPSITPVIEALRARLAQPEPEPVAWFCKLPDNKISIKIVGKPTEGNWEPLYAAPQKKEWQGLTDDEVSEILDDVIGFNSCFGPETEFASAIEAKLKEKNQ